MATKHTLSRKKPPDARIERQIITGLIIDSRFAREIIPIYTPESLRLDYARTIADWCVEYYQQYERVPGRMIEDIYATRSKSLEETQAEDIEDFLSSISDEHAVDSTFNTDYMLDKAERHFRLNALQSIREGITRNIVGGRVDEAEQLIGNFRRVARAATQGVDPFVNDQSIINAFATGNSLVKMPGDFGRSLGSIERGFLIAVVGQAKTGKTWWLMIMALRAALMGFKVLFVSCEMSEGKMIIRLYQNLLSAPTPKWAGVPLMIPQFDCVHNQLGTCDIRGHINTINIKGRGDDLLDFHQAPKGYKPCAQCRQERHYEPAVWHKQMVKDAVSAERAIKKMNSMKRGNFLRGGGLRIVEFPSNSLTMREFKAYLDNLSYYEGYEPDFIITDYADKFAAENTNQQYRHQLNEIWEGHKAIAQERHAVVITASQSNTARTGKDIKQGDFAEDIRKLNLIDLGFSINQKPDEKRIGLTRALVLASRHDDFDQLNEVWVLGQLKIGMPYIDSYDPYG